MRKSNTEKYLELKYNKDIAILLRIDYLDNKMTIAEIAKKYGVAYCTIQKWMIKYNIPRRKLTFQ